MSGKAPVTPKHPFAAWDTLSPTDPSLENAELKGVIRHIEVRDIEIGVQDGIDANEFHKNDNSFCYDIFLGEKISRSNSYISGNGKTILGRRRAVAYITVDTVEGHPSVLRVEGVPLFASFMVQSKSLEQTRSYVNRVLLPHMQSMVSDTDGCVVKSEQTFVSDGFQMADEHVGDRPMHLVRVGVSSVSARKYFENPRINIGEMLKDKDPDVRVWNMVMREDRESDAQQILLQMGPMPLSKWMCQKPDERAKVACGVPGCGTSILCPKEKLRAAKLVVSRYGREVVTTSLRNIEVLAEPCVPPTHHIALDCEMVSALNEEQALENLERYGTREPFPQASNPNHQIISVSLCHWLDRNAATTHMEFLILEVGPGGTEHGVETALTHPTAFAQAEAIRKKTLEKVKMTCEFPSVVRKITFADPFQMIRALFKYISHGPFVAMHGHNLHSFDLPYIWRYYIAHSKDELAQQRALYWTPFIGVEVFFKQGQKSEFKATELLTTNVTASFSFAWRVSPMVIGDTMIMDMFMKPKHTVDGMRLENLTKNIFGVGGKMEGMSGARVTDAYLKGQIDDIHAYCAIDTWLSMRVNTYLKIYSSVCMLAQLANINPCTIATNPTTCKGVLFKGMFSNVALMNNHVARSKLPEFPHNDCGYPGGFVVDPKETGILKNIITLDFNSLYPSIIIANNLCYSTILGIYDRPVNTATPPFRGVPYTEHVVEMKEKEEEGGGAPKKKTNGGGKKEALFKIYVYIRKADGPGGKKGILPIMCEHLIKLRKQFKRLKADSEASRDKSLELAASLEGTDSDARDKALADAAVEDAKAIIYDIQQSSTKVVTNSVYGLLGSASEAIACKIIAALVTQIGRNSIQEVPLFLCTKYARGVAIFDDLIELIQRKNGPPEYIVISILKLLKMWQEWAQRDENRIDTSFMEQINFKELLGAENKQELKGFEMKTLASVLQLVVEKTRSRWSNKEGVDIVAGDTDSVMIRLRPGAFLPPFTQDGLAESLIHMDLVGWVCSLVVKQIPGLDHSAMNMEHEDNCLMFIIRENTKKRYLKLFASPGKHEERSKKVQGFASKKSDSRTITSNMQQALENAILSFDNFGGNPADLQEKLMTILIHHLARAVRASGQDCVLAHDEEHIDEEELYRSASAWSKLSCIGFGKTSQVIFKGDVCPFTIKDIQAGKFFIDGHPVQVSGDGQHVALKRWALQGKPVELNVTEVQSVVMADMHIAVNGRIETLHFEIPTFHTSGEEVKMKLNGKSHPKLWDLSLLEQAISIADSSPPHEKLRRPRLDISYMLGMECNGVIDLLICVLPRTTEGVFAMIQALYHQAVEACRVSLIDAKPVAFPVEAVEGMLRETYARFRGRGAKQTKLDNFFKKAPAPLPPPATLPLPSSPLTAVSVQGVSTPTTSEIAVKMDTSPDKADLGVDRHCEMRFNGNFDLCWKEISRHFDNPEKYFRLNFKACTADFGTMEKFKTEVASLREQLSVPESLLDEEEEDDDVKAEIAARRQEREEKARIRKQKEAISAQPKPDDEFEYGPDLHCKRRFEGDYQAMFESFLMYEVNMDAYWKKFRVACVEDFADKECFVDGFKQVMDDKVLNLKKMDAKKREAYFLSAFDRDEDVRKKNGESSEAECDEMEEEEIDEETEEKQRKKKRGRFVDAFFDDAAASGEDEEVEDEFGEGAEAARILASKPLQRPSRAARMMGSVLSKYDPLYRSEGEEEDEEGNLRFMEFCKGDDRSPSLPSLPSSPVPTTTTTTTRERPPFTVQKRKTRVWSEDEEERREEREERPVAKKVIDLNSIPLGLIKKSWLVDP